MENNTDTNVTAPTTSATPSVGVRLGSAAIGGLVTGAFAFAGPVVSAIITVKSQKRLVDAQTQMFVSQTNHDNLPDQD